MTETPDPTTAASQAGPPAGRDEWPHAEPYRLIGWAERESFNPLLSALLGGVFAFVVFQGVALVATALLVGEQLMGATSQEEIATVLAANPDRVFAANAIGQVIGLGMFTILLARLHTPDVLAYLRVQRVDVLMLLAACVGLLALMPFVSWVGELAQHLPFPDTLRAWDEQQQELIARVLEGDVTLPLALLFVALTPAICEELIFRGFIQRNVERRIGPMWAIVVVGLAFGLFHLRFIEFIPLALLGVYLCYVVWVTGSLWTGVAVHLLNNGTAVLVSDYARTRPEPVVLEDLTIPWYLAMSGLLVALAIILFLKRRREALLSGAPT
jgi:uncharacterized protein